MTEADQLTRLLDTASHAVGEVHADTARILTGARRARHRRRVFAAGAGVTIVALVSAAVAPRLLDERDSVDVAAGGPVRFPEGWSRLPDPPLSPRTGATVVSTGEQIVVVGGSTFLCPPGADCAPPEENTTLRDGAAYDVERRTWHVIADAPVGFADSRATVVDGDVFVFQRGALGPFGGRTDNGPRLLRYRPSVDKWEMVPAPSATRFDQLTPFGDVLVVSATSDEQGERTDWRFDPASGTWTRLPDDPLPNVYDRRLVVDGDDLLLFAKETNLVGGETPPVIGARFDATTGTWTRLPDAPGSGFQAWGIDGQVVLNPHFAANLRGGIFDPSTDTWRPLPPFPVADTWRGDMAGVIGTASAVFERTDGWALDVAARRWVEIPDLEADQSYAESNLTAVGRSLVVYGGEHWPEDGSEGRLLGDAWVWTPPAPEA